MDKKKYTEFYNSIKYYQEDFTDYHQRCEKIVAKYLDENNRSAYEDKRYNILWSNTRVISAAVFARLPKVEVSRRFQDSDPVARVATILLERVVDYILNNKDNFFCTMKAAVQDYLLVGRATTWIRYEPHQQKATQLNQAIDGVELTGDRLEFNPTMIEHEQLESACVDFVNYINFGHSFGRTWEEVDHVWRVVYMSKEQLISRFGESLGNKIPIDEFPDTFTKTNSSEKSKQQEHQAKIYEIWCKTTKKVYWLNIALGEIIDEIDDPLHLTQFFPCNKPLYYTISNNNLIPVPMYVYYQDQARQLDEQTYKISKLVDAISPKGVYDASNPEIESILTNAGITDFVPIKNLAALTESGGILNAIQFVDIKPFYEALVAMQNSMQITKEQIYDLIGISDILRGGTTQQYETATAQSLKTNNGISSLKMMQQEITFFATQIVQSMAELICKHFDAETIMIIANVQNLQQVDQQIVPLALQLLKNNLLRNFRIEVTTDSMHYLTELQDKQDRIEFLGVISNFIAQFVPVIEASPVLTPMIIEMLKFSLAPFRIGKTLEGVINDTIARLTMMQQQQKPDPQVQKVQIEQQFELQKLQIQQQFAIQKLQIEQEFLLQKEEKELQLEMAKLQISESAKMQEIAMQKEARTAELQLEVEKEQASQQLQLEEASARIQMEKERNIATEEAEIEKERLRIEAETIKDMRLKTLENITKIDIERMKLGLSNGATAMLQNSQEISLLDGVEMTIKDELTNLANNAIAPITEQVSNTNADVEQVKQLIDQLIVEQKAPKRAIRDEQGNITQLTTLQ